LYNAERDVLYCAADFGLSSDYRQHPHVPIPRAQYEAQVQQVRPIIVLPDAQAIPNLPDTALNVRTIVVAAMRREGHLVGTLNASTVSASRAFSADELALLRSLAIKPRKPSPTRGCLNKSNNAAPNSAGSTASRTRSPTRRISTRSST
jgi:hypothetical protein